MWQLLSDVRARRGTTVIVALHNQTLSEHTDRRLELVDGRLVSPEPAASEQTRPSMPCPL